MLELKKLSHTEPDVKKLCLEMLETGSHELPLNLTTRYSLIFNLNFMIHSIQI